MADLALLLWLVYFLLALGLRVLLQGRRTGRSGLLLMRGAAGRAQRLGEGGEVLALALGVAAPALAGSVEPIDALDGETGHAAGIGLFALGLAGVVVSQETMGASWRIGQDPADPTGLVTRGPFRVIRNPIFTALVCVQLGLALLVPSAIALAGLALMALSVEVQVRLVEEPHLMRAHGDAYRAYARAVGRFLPRTGRLT
jgi:protein-S-isoprenylcysteine O-methyltransferase Ste14